MFRETLFRYVDTQGAFFQAERHVLPQLNADLDNPPSPRRRCYPIGTPSQCRQGRAALVSSKPLLLVLFHHSTTISGWYHSDARKNRRFSA